ncbi:skin secretory protein xP2-like [Bos taurus]|uniref:skin secretory protein xP2-like n=1 Tax=Bos taurus TaxID=9913 RepID=UPI0028CB6253|nr:skin secretory protein xP2-like [Bos taurus]
MNQLLSFRLPVIIGKSWKESSEGSERRALRERFLPRSPSQELFSLSSNFSTNQRREQPPHPLPESQGCARRPPPPSNSGRSDAAAAAEGDSAHPDRGTGTRAGGCPRTGPGPTQHEQRVAADGGLPASSPVGPQAPSPAPSPDGDPETRKAAGGQRGAVAQTYAPGPAGRREGREAEPTEERPPPKCPQPSGPDSPRFPAPRPRARDAARASPGAPQGCSPKPLRPALRHRSLARTSETQREEGGALPRTARAARHRTAPAFRPRRRAAPGQFLHFGPVPPAYCCCSPAHMLTWFPSPPTES